MSNTNASDPYAQFKATFFEECGELLGDIDDQLRRIQDGDADNEDLNAIFRAVHSIKAGAGTFSFARLVTFTHQFEALLDCLREGAISVRPDIVDVLYSAFDIVGDLVAMMQNGDEAGEDYGAEVLGQIETLLAEAQGQSGGAPEPVGSSEADPDYVGEIGSRVWTIRFAPHAALYRCANDPLLLFRELRTLGNLSIEADLSKLPDVTRMETDLPYISWTLQLETEADASQIEEVFEFVLDECDLVIEPCETSDALETAPIVEDAAGDVPAEAAENSAPAVAKAADKPAEGSGTTAAKATSIRVDLARVDRLVNLVGELVITQATMAQQLESLAGANSSLLMVGQEEMATHTRELQELVMAIRMQPVKSVFTRMSRVVRDLNQKLGKKTQLVLNGEQTELDKTVLEELIDPLTHMVRNSLDHGIETPDERATNGKPGGGRLELFAEHRGGRIVIEIADDGRGIDREKVLTKAVERELVAEDAQLSNEEIDNLIFLPGFSTSAKVTDVSGRGVGMDVVRSKIASLGGRVSISSEPGKGSRFTLTLPLTLAVLDGMVLKVGDQTYVVPLASIVESIKPQPADISRLVNGELVLRRRGEYLKIVSLSRLFDVDGAITEPSEGLVVLVETGDRRKVGILVDELLGQRQVVMKSLETNYGKIEGVSSATILGNGRVSLILDIDELAEMDTRRHGGMDPESTVPEDTVDLTQNDDQPAAMAS